MPDISRKKTLDELKSEAIAKLERRGFDVRGKTPAQIRQMLRARSPRPKSTAKSSGQTSGISDDKQNQTKSASITAIKGGRASLSKDGGPR
jgi:hypothetical protein